MHLVYYTFVIANRIGHPLETKVKYIYIYGIYGIYAVLGKALNH